VRDALIGRAPKSLRVIRGPAARHPNHAATVSALRASQRANSRALSLTVRSRSNRQLSVTERQFSDIISSRARSGRTMKSP
jgi:ribosomal protein L30/L7E